MADALPGIVGFVAGLVLGGFFVWLWDRARLGVLRERISRLGEEVGLLRPYAEENQRLRIALAEVRKEHGTEVEKNVWVERSQTQLREAFEALAGRTLESNSEAFLKRARDQIDALLQQARGELKTQRSEIQRVVEPLEKNLHDLGGHLRQLEEKREGAYQSLQEQLRQLGHVHRQLSESTVRLTESLKSPTVRGRWGEMQLRRVVEMAGMAPHVDFVEQATGDSRRPDLIVRLPNGGILPVDAKAPMDAFLEAIEAPDEATRKTRLDAHAGAMRHRAHELGQRRYWDQFENAPEFVVMFVPNEACLSLAFERDGDFLEYSFRHNVLPSTPVTLLALLKAVAYGWQQSQITENARRIALSGKELYERLGIFIEHLGRAGKGIQGAVDAYNQAVGSLERRVVPSVRRLRELGVASDDLPAPESVTTQTRTPSALPVEEKSTL